LIVLYFVQNCSTLVACLDLLGLGTDPYQWTGDMGCVISFGTEEFDLFARLRCMCDTNWFHFDCHL